MQRETKKVTAFSLAILLTASGVIGQTTSAALSEEPHPRAENQEEQETQGQAGMLDCGEEPTGGNSEEKRAAQDIPETPPRARIDPKLVGKQVIIHLHDGRVYEGRLVETTPDSVRLKMETGFDPREGKPVFTMEEIALSEVAFIERRKGRAWIPFAVVGLGIAAVAVGVLIAAMQD